MRRSTKAETRHCIIDVPMIQHNWWRQCKWNKQADETLPVCTCILSSLSIYTPMLYTDETIWTMVKQVCSAVSIIDTFFIFALEPNQMASVLLAFIWRRLNEHQSLISATHCFKIERLVWIAARHMFFCCCLSFVYRWWFIVCVYIYFTYIYISLLFCKCWLVISFVFIIYCSCLLSVTMAV